MSIKLVRFLAAGALGVALAAPAMAANDQGVHNVVLVHGAWADGSSWAKVIPILENAGLKVTAVQNPLTSFEDDVAATKRVLALQDGPVILVGHSWGGVVITEAGADPKVAGLVYVAAFAPEAGVKVGDLGKDFPAPPGGAEIKPDASGYLTLTWKGVNERFAPDLTPAERKIVYATQGQTNSTVFGAQVTGTPWKTKPSWSVIAADDQMISPDLERRQAQAMSGKSITLKSSHVAMLSHPREVAKLIIEAAHSAKP
jgi:pimeloyl-ACP methyl ester carboxylesterase